MENEMWAYGEWSAFRNRSRRRCVSRETLLRGGERGTNLFHVKHPCVDISGTTPELARPSLYGLREGHVKLWAALRELKLFE
jgi:hypothetical protein